MRSRTIVGLSSGPSQQGDIYSSPALYRRIIPSVRTISNLSSVSEQLTPADAGVELSVIIPCYNVELYVEDTIRSLRRNLDDGFEFIFVDDSSTDYTPWILQREIPGLPGGRVITNPTNVGLAAARNVGINAARGRYLAFLDGDDLVMPGYYRQLVAQIRDLQVDFLRTDHVRFTATHRVIDRIQFGPRRRPADPRSGILPTDRNTAVDYPFAWAGVFDRRLAERGLLHFTPGLRTCEDRPWIWRLHLQAESFAAANLLGVLYRRNVANSLSQVSDDRQFDFIPAFDEIVTGAETDWNAERYLPKALRSYSAIICHQLSRMDAYEPHLAEALLRRCEEAVQRLPRQELEAAVADLDPRRQQLMTELMMREPAVTRP
jgi:glycosyltransferase involved in cell wall biosynthesis